MAANADSQITKPLHTYTHVYMHIHTLFVASKIAGYYRIFSQFSDFLS